MRGLEKGFCAAPSAQQPPVPLLGRSLGNQDPIWNLKRRQGQWKAAIKLNSKINVLTRHPQVLSHWTTGDFPAIREMTCLIIIFETTWLALLHAYHHHGKYHPHSDHDGIWAKQCWQRRGRTHQHDSGMLGQRCARPRCASSTSPASSSATSPVSSSSTASPAW